MTTALKDLKIAQARCRQCDSDLVTREDGLVYCTKQGCKYNIAHHKTGPNPNQGKG